MKLIKTTLFCCIISLLSCENENIPSDNKKNSQDQEIIDAEIWFQNFKEKGDFHPIFKDVRYNWEYASKIKLIDGSIAIALPITENKQNPLSINKMELYLYPITKGYNAFVYELTPDLSQIIKNNSFEKLDYYNGYIGTWDLKKGLIKGARFTNGIEINAMNLRIISKMNTKSSTTYKEAPIRLDEVVVYGGSTGSTTFGVRDFSISSLFGVSGNNTGSYFVSHRSGSGGGASGSISSTTDLKIMTDSTKPEAFDIKLFEEQNQKIAKASFNLLPWCGINVFVTQNIGVPNTIESVTTNAWGVTLGFTWAQDGFSVNKNGRITTITIIGTLTLNSGFNGVGNVYSSTESFEIILDNRNGNILSGKRNL